MVIQDSRFLDLAWIGPAVVVGTLVVVIAVRVRRDARRFEEERAKASPEQEPDDESEEDLPPPPEVVQVTGYLSDHQAAEVVARLQQAGIPAVAVFHSEDDFITGRGGATQVGSVVVVPPDRQPEAVQLLEPHGPEGNATMAEIEQGFREGEPLPPNHPDPGPQAAKNARLLFFGLLILGLLIALFVLVR